jgi:hypothetical protein
MTTEIKQTGPDQDINQIFADLEELAKKVNPNLLSEIASFNENHVALESYQNFIHALNQPPVSTTSNHVNC